MPMLPRHKIDRDRPSPVAAQIPLTVEWVHEIVRRACPRALAFHLASEFPGSFTVVVELDDPDGGGVRYAHDCDVLQRALVSEAPVGVAFIVRWFATVDGDVVKDPPVCHCGARLNEKHRTSCYLDGVVTSRPTARSINEMQEAAVAEINRLTAEVTSLRRALGAEEGAHETDAKIAGKRAEEAKQLRSALDEQTRFLAGLDDRRWSKPEQEQRRVLVGKAHDLLRVRPFGTRVDKLKALLDAGAIVVPGAGDGFWKRMARASLGAQRQREDVSRWQKLIGIDYQHSEMTDAERKRICDEILRRDPYAQALIAAKKDEA
jgi:hypothetical protein